MLLLVPRDPINDLSVRAYFMTSARHAMHDSALADLSIKNAVISVKKIGDRQAAATLSSGAASGTFNEFTLAPRQYLETVSFGF